MKIMICGLGRAGKDQLAEHLAEYLSCDFRSSSHVAMDMCIWNNWGRYLYSDKEACYEDRINHRMEWKNRIIELNRNDLTTLGRGIFGECDIYVGCRAIAEFQALKDAGVFDLSIWVDSSQRLPNLVDESCEITSSNCDIVVGNNGTLGDLKYKTGLIAAWVKDNE